MLPLGLYPFFSKTFPCHQLAKLVLESKEIEMVKQILKKKFEHTNLQRFHCNFKNTCQTHNCFTIKRKFTTYKIKIVNY